MLRQQEEKLSYLKTEEALSQELGDNKITEEYSWLTSIKVIAKEINSLTIKESKKGEPKFDPETLTFYLKQNPTLQEVMMVTRQFMETRQKEGKKTKEDITRVGITLQDIAILLAKELKNTKITDNQARKKLEETLMEIYRLGVVIQTLELKEERIPFEDLTEKTLHYPQNEEESKKVYERELWFFILGKYHPTIALRNEQDMSSYKLRKKPPPRNYWDMYEDWSERFLKTKLRRVETNQLGMPRLFSDGINPQLRELHEAIAAIEKGDLDQEDAMKVIIRVAPNIRDIRFAIRSFSGDMTGQKDKTREAEIVITQYILNKLEDEAFRVIDIITDRGLSPNLETILQTLSETINTLMSRQKELLTQVFETKIWRKRNLIKQQVLKFILERNSLSPHTDEALKEVSRTGIEGQFLSTFLEHGLDEVEEKMKLPKRSFTAFLRLLDEYAPIQAIEILKNNYGENILFKKAGDEIKKREEKEGKLTPYQKAEIIFRLVAHYPYKVTYSLTEAIKSREFECNLKAIIAADLLRKLAPEIKVFGVSSVEHAFLGLQIGSGVYAFDPTNDIFRPASTDLLQAIRQYTKSGQITSRHTSDKNYTYRYAYYKVGPLEKILLSSLLGNIALLKKSAPYLQIQITNLSRRIHSPRDLPLKSLGVFFYRVSHF